jgi:ParB family transcriptional regulator, chromosome partitioning protein
VKSVVFGSQAPGLNDSALAKAMDDRHRRWSEQLPREPGDLWNALLDSTPTAAKCCSRIASRSASMRCTSRGIDVPHAFAHADRLAEAVELDIAATGWSPTVENYLGRVTKTRIVQAVREVKGEGAAQLIDHLKKGEMAERAQELLTGAGWLPEPPRTPGRPIAAPASLAESEVGPQPESTSAESAEAAHETAMADSTPSTEDEAVAAEAHAVAAE